MIGGILLCAAAAGVALVCFAVLFAKKELPENRVPGRPSVRAMFVSIGALLFLEAVCFFVIAFATGLGHGTNDQIYWTKQVLCLAVVFVMPMAGLVICRLYPRRWLAIFLFAVCGVALAYSTVTLTPGLRAQVVDQQGRAVRDAVLYYSQIPAQNGPSAGYGVKKAGADGRFRIWTKVSVHFPFLYRLPFHDALLPAKLDLFVFSPQFHHLLRAENALAVGGASAAQAREATAIVLRDASDAPEAWFRSLQDMTYAAHYVHLGGNAAQKRELVASWRKDYDEFVSRYASALRAASSPGEDVRPWRFYLQQKRAYGRNLEEDLAFYEQAFAGRTR